MSDIFAAWGLMASTAQPAMGKDGGGSELGPKASYADCVVAEYVWLDAHGVPRSKTKTLAKKPCAVFILSAGYRLATHSHRIVSR